jgi:hypothetical protein
VSRWRGIYTPTVQSERNEESTMFKKLFELITLKWLWDRRGGRRRA